MIFVSVVISGLTLSKTCWELEDVDIRLNKFSEDLYPPWWSNLLIGCLWRFFAILSQVVSIVFFLIFFWVSFLYKTRFGSPEFDNSKLASIFGFGSSSNIDYNDILKGEEESLVKYYLYILPVALFFVPFVVNIWARCKYIGLTDEYSIAYGFLSAVVPVWYVYIYFLTTQFFKRNYLTSIRNQNIFFFLIQQLSSSNRQDKICYVSFD